VYPKGSKKALKAFGCLNRISVILLGIALLTLRFALQAGQYNNGKTDCTLFIQTILLMMVKAASFSIAFSQFHWF